jgi:hypothetical protein
MPSTSTSDEQGPRASTSAASDQYEHLEEVHVEEPDDDEDTSEERALCIMSQADKENQPENRKMDVFESLIRCEQQLAAIYEIKMAKAHQSLANDHRKGTAKRMKLIQELIVQKKI